MSNRASVICRSEDRRAEVRRRDYNGIDYLEVSDDQRTLSVHLFRGAPEDISVHNVTVEGGVRVLNIRVVSVEASGGEHDDGLQVIVDRPGDFSNYTLRFIEVDANG